MTEGKPVPERDFLAELEAASKPARDLLREAGTYINYLRTVIRDMLPYFPKDHPYHVGFSEAASPAQVAEVGKSHPTPWRIDRRNVPLADTGDYDGLTQIFAADGEEVAQWWNSTDEEEELAERIVQTINAAPRLTAERDAARLISRKRKELLVEAGVLEPDECEGCKMHHPLVGEYHEHGPSGIRTKCSSVTRKAE